ncbi:MAG: efflux RND transporter periplasmic adaptor subunit, partial [Marinobacter sp.]|nr:efflux RND transporter periplasmic adaptor subunit [Marinobacter sp.]
MASSLVRPAMAMLIVALVVETGSRSVQAEPAVSGAAKGSDAQVTLKPLTITLTSDVQVRQSPVIRLRAAHPGILSELAVAPGDPVTAGEVIGHLGGPAITAALKQAKSDLRAAQTAVKTNQSLLTLAQQRADAHFGSRQEVYQATLARDAAKARVANSKVSLHRLQTQHSLRAPADGVISATPSVAGDAVRDGDAIVSIQPDRALWLEGQYFGAELRQVRTGQTGVFTPSDDAAPMTVEVTGLLPVSNGLTVRF